MTIKLLILIFLFVHLQTLLSENNGVVDGPATDLQEYQLMSLSYQLLLQVLNITFSWWGDPVPFFLEKSIILKRLSSILLEMSVCLLLVLSFCFFMCDCCLHVCVHSSGLDLVSQDSAICWRRLSVFWQDDSKTEMLSWPWSSLWSEWLSFRARLEKWMYMIWLNY